MKLHYLIFGLLAGLASLWAVADPELVAIMGSKASISFGGRRVLMSAGETRDGIKLIAINEESVVLESGGKRSTVQLGQRFYAGGGAAGSATSATLYDSGSGHFFADVGIGSGVSRGIVDTGATLLVLSARQAAAAGVKLDGGRSVAMSTAQGRDVAVLVQLPEVRIAGIALYNVDALVSRGNYPEVLLIGMSVLSHFNMQRDGDHMTLTKKY
jgi:aspartyl protease family protein